jgi:hypothetical protein
MLAITPRISAAEHKLITRSLMEQVKSDDVEGFAQILSTPGLPVKYAVRAVVCAEAPKISELLAVLGITCRARTAIIAATSGNMVFLRNVIPGCEVVVREMVFFVLLLSKDVSALREFVKFAPAPYCKDIGDNRVFVGDTVAGKFDASEFEGKWAWPVDLEGSRGYVSRDAAHFAARKLKKLSES